MSKQIVSASRRTDIPAFYSEWFINRLRAGFVMVQNPRNPAQIMRVSLDINDVAAIVFWSRNYGPLLPHLDEIDRRGFRPIFHLTLTNYGRRLEKSVPNTQLVFRHFEALANRYGQDRIIWRYDPIILGSSHGSSFHLDNFCYLAEEIRNFSSRCILSFLDRYNCTNNNLSRITEETFDSPTLHDRAQLALSLVREAELRAITCSACCESDLGEHSIAPAACIDADLIRKVADMPLLTLKPAPTRKGCGCVYVRDIGAYQTCAHGCVYCYANDSPESGISGRASVNPGANALGPTDLVESRPLVKNRKQLRLFEDR